MVSITDVHDEEERIVTGLPWNFEEMIRLLAHPKLIPRSNDLNCGGSIINFGKTESKKPVARKT